MTRRKTNPLLRATLTVRLPPHGELRRHFVDVIRESATVLRGESVCVRSKVPEERGVLLVSHKNAWCFQSTALTPPMWQLSIARQVSRHVTPTITWVDDEGRSHVPGQQQLELESPSPASQAMFESFWDEKNKQHQSPR